MAHPGLALQSLRDGYNVVLAGCLERQVDCGPGGRHLYEVHTDHDCPGRRDRLGEARQQRRVGRRQDPNRYGIASSRRDRATAW